MRQLVLDRIRNDPSATQTISLSTLVSVRLTHQQAVALSERLWGLIQEFHDDPEAAARELSDRLREDWRSDPAMTPYALAAAGYTGTVR